MKKALVFILIMLLSFSLWACSETNEPYSVEINQKTFTVDPKANTISDGKYTYEYTFSGDYDSYRIEITYPDGSTYYESTRESGAPFGWSDDYSEYRYERGSILCRAVEEGIPESAASRNPLLGLILVSAGFFHFAAPHTAWYFEMGWKFKDAEPSDLILIVYRVIGAVSIILGILAFFLI